MNDLFRALVMEQSGGGGNLITTVKMVDFEAIQPFDENVTTVTVKVEFSSLNYKDGLILKGLGNLTKSYPHVPGIDLAGTVEASDDSRYQPGDKVFATGGGLGQTTWGGYAEKAKVKSDWLTHLPEGLTTRRIMTLGTAGLAAMLSVLTLEENGITPDSGDILVTGAAGGLGSVAIAILSQLGYRVVASTGRLELSEYLANLGAAEIIDRAELSEAKPKPLETQRWAACIDSVGGQTLATVLASIKECGAVAACGLADNSKLPTTVMPFILRGVKLLGTDNRNTPVNKRNEAWKRVAGILPAEKLDAMITEVGLSDISRLATEILAGKVRGRIVVSPTANAAMLGT